MHGMGTIVGSSGSHCGPVYDGNLTAMYRGSLPELGSSSSFYTIPSTVPIAPLKRPHCGWKFLPLIATLQSLHSTVTLGMSDLLKENKILKYTDVKPSQNIAVK